MTITITVDQVREFCNTSLSDAAIESLICVVQDKMGACAESSYSECVAEQILIYAVCHLAESQSGSATQKKAANGASITTEYFGTGEGIKSTPSGRLLVMIDTAGCHNGLIASPLIFTTVGNTASVC